MKWGSSFFILISSLIAITAAAQSNGLCVTKSGAVLRSSPSTKAPMSWQVPKFMPLLATGKDRSGFSEVQDLEGQKHWVQWQDVSAKVRCVVVKSRRSRLREGPGTKFDTAEAGIADRYTSFQDLGGEDGWTMVQDELGQKSWVDLDHVWKPRTKFALKYDNR